MSSALVTCDSVYLPVFPVLGQWFGLWILLYTDPRFVDLSVCSSFYLLGWSGSLPPALYMGRGKGKVSLPEYLTQKRAHLNNNSILRHYVLGCLLYSST